MDCIRERGGGFGNCLAEMGDRAAQRRQLGAIGQHDRLVKTQGPGHDATPQQNGDLSRAAAIRSGRHQPLFLRGKRPVYLAFSELDANFPAQGFA